MDLIKDNKNHLFAEVGNCRVTYIPARDRSPDKDWAGSDVIRLQAYRGADSKALHMGAELPIESPAEFVELIAALCQLYTEGREEGTGG
jgi:hypothetical protein